MANSEKEFLKAKAKYDEFRKSLHQAEVDTIESIDKLLVAEWKEFSFIASELHRRKIEVVITVESGNIQLINKDGKSLTFNSLSEVKAFAIGLDWGVKNARDMAFYGLTYPICKKEAL